MKLDHGRTCVAVALAVVAAGVRGELNVPFTDDFFSGVVQVRIGSPATTYTLSLSTGCGNTFLGAGQKYTETSTSKNTGQHVAIVRGSGDFSGIEYVDRLDLSGTTFQQSIGVATPASGPNEGDGILGLGPVGLTVGTLSPDTTAEIPTVADSLLSSGAVDSATVTIGNGRIIFGSPLVSISDIIYAPVTGTYPAGNYWGVDAGFSYGATTLSSSTAGIVDHGTTLLLLDTNVFYKFLQATGAVLDNKTGVPKLPENSCAGLRPISLKYGGGNFDIPVGQYRVPAQDNASIGGDSSKCYLAVGDIGERGSQGLDFILGYNILKHFTVVLDKANSRVGISNLAIEV